MEYVSDLSSNDKIIDLSGSTSNNVSVTKTSDVIININGSTKNPDSETIPEELSILYNYFKINKYIDHMCIDMFASWEPKFFKHIYEEVSNIIYFDPI